MVTSCTEVNAWDSGCSSVSGSEDQTDPSNGEQRFMAAADQMLFTLTAFEYAPGTNSLSVHKNGLLVDPNNVQELSATTFWLQGEVVNPGDIVVAHALTGVTAEVEVLTTSLFSSQAVLVDGQLVVPFPSTTPVVNSALYISGNGVDDSRLVQDTDYIIDITNNIVNLTDSYPAGTVLLLVYNDAGAANVSLLELPSNTVWHEFSSEIGTKQHLLLTTGAAIRTNYFDSAATPGSGANFKFTGTIDLLKAGNVPDADGFFYDVDGKQFSITGDINVRQFGAIGDAVADDIVAMQIAADAVNALGGGLIKVPAGEYLISAPLTIYTGTRFIGECKNNTIIRKTTGTVVAASLVTNLVCLDLSPMGDGAGDVNCILFISDPIRSQKVEVAHMSLTTNAINSTTSPVRFGIVSDTGLSESSIHDLEISNIFSASFVTPTIFFSSIYLVEGFQVGQHLSIENGTSNSIYSNYAHRPHRYGYFIRDMKYSSIVNNACDSLNNVADAVDYTDRSIDSVAYMISACLSTKVENNGAEQCFGTQFKLDSCQRVSVKKNFITGPASSYTGGNEVAIFYIDSLARGVEIESNTVSRGGVTALQGAAAANQHHDLYVDVVSNNRGFKYQNNYLSDALTDNPSDIYGNNVPAYINSQYQSSQLSGEFTPIMNLLTATGVTITYGAENKGRYSIVNGFMYLDITVHLATVAFSGTTDIRPQLNGLPLVNGDSIQLGLMIDKSEGVTWPSTEQFSFQIDSGFGTGLARNRDRTATLGDGPIPSFLTGATDIKFHCYGAIYVGDNANIT